MEVAVQRVTNLIALIDPELNVSCSRSPVSNSSPTLVSTPSMRGNARTRFGQGWLTGKPERPERWRQARKGAGWNKSVHATVLHPALNL